MGTRDYLINLGGVGPKEQREEATVTIGRGIDALKALVGVTLAPGKVGHALSPAEVRSGVIEGESLQHFLRMTRHKQAGEAGWTLRRSEGFYEGSTEPVFELVLKWYASESEPTFAAFEQNILDLAENTAFAFAQKEIIVGLTAPNGDYIYRVSPTGFPAPGGANVELNKFIKAVTP